MNASPHAAGPTAQGAPRAGVEDLWAWLSEVPDPEIPVISIVDLGIVRDVRRREDGRAVVTLTPTYSGCPATEVISQSVRDALEAHGVQALVETRLSPAWTTDWLAPAARERLRAYGIAPPVGRAAAGEQPIDASRILRRSAVAPRVPCPHCGSTHTETVSAFGSTPCKALYRCRDCCEPFDYFKCH